MSKSKAVKANIRDKAQYKFKEKGKKPINVSGIANFMLTGADFDATVLAQLLESQGIVSLDNIGASSTPTAPKGSPPASPPKQPAAAAEG